MGHLAAAAVGEEKHARAGAVLVNGHSGSPERLKFRLSGKPAQEKSRAHFSMAEVWHLGMELSSRMLVKGRLGRHLRVQRAFPAKAGERRSQNPHPSTPRVRHPAGLNGEIVCRLDSSEDATCRVDTK